MSSGLPPVPNGLDLEEDRRSTLIAATVVTFAIALASLVLRVISRKIKGLPLRLEDWLIVAALIPDIGHISAIAGYAVSHGVGLHIWAAAPDGVYAWALGLFVAEICYTLTLVLVKLSILAFYWNTFSVTASMRMLIWILVGLTCTWGVAVLLVTFLQCIPIRAHWSRFDPAHPMLPDEYRCDVDAKHFFIGNAIPNIVTDILLMALPLPYIWSLRLPLRQKLALGGIFVVGIFVTIISVLRLVQVLNLDLADPDITWNFVDSGMWTLIEGHVAILCACLPFLKPVINRFTSGFFGTSQSPSQPTKDASKNTQSKQQPVGWGLDKIYGHSSTYILTRTPEEHPFSPLQDDDLGRGTLQNNKGSMELQDLSLNGIVVTREVHMERQSGPKQYI